MNRKEPNPAILTVRNHGKGRIGIHRDDPELIAHGAPAIVAAVADACLRPSIEAGVGKPVGTPRLALLAWRVDAGGVLVLVDEGALSHPGEWGIALADLVGHVCNAYIATGLDPATTRQCIIEALHAELNAPTERAVQIGTISG